MPAMVPTSFQVTDGDAAYNTPAEVVALANAGVVGEEKLIWRYTGKPQQAVYWGVGTVGRPVTAAMLHKATPTVANGHLIFKVTDANRLSIRYVMELPIIGLHKPAEANATALSLLNFDIEQVPSFPMMGEPIGEDDRMEIYYRKGGTDIDGSNFDDVAWVIPITREYAGL